MSKFELLAEVAPAQPAKGDKKAVGPTYRVAYAKDGFPELEGVKTLHELFQRSAKKFATRPCVGHRPIVDGKPQPFEFLSYQEIADMVAEVAAGYAALGAKPKDKVSICGVNCTEWMLAMQGCNYLNLVCVPLYETLGETAIEYIINHAECRLVLTSAAKLPIVAEALPNLKTKLDALVYWGQPDRKALEAVSSGGHKVLSFDDLRKLGRDAPVTPSPPAPEDLCTIMYTSGTTGDPKGVMLPHRAMVATISSINAFLDHAGERIDQDDRFLSYLPLAHVFDRAAEEFMLNRGGTIGYWGGDIRQISDDIAALKPTLFVGVPRVLDRIHTGVVDQVKKGGILSQAVYSMMYNRKLYYMKNGWKHDEASPVSDHLVFNKIKKRLGGCVRVVVSGAAPLSTHVEEFLKVAMCAPVVQGYGLTETCAASFIAVPHCMDQTGTVGPPMPCTELRLVAVPEMGYDPMADPPKGEVLIGGPGVFAGYYKDEKKTREDLDADGFFHTGDIGELSGDGVLRIIDRMKNIFKLSQGEYIAVEKLENAYKQCDLVEQLWVYGNSFESVLVAVVVPKEKQLMAWAEKNGLGGQDFKAVCSSQDGREYVLQQLAAAGKSSKLKGFEAIKAVHLEPEQFSVENDLMTPTFKLKRAPLLKHYQKQVDEMYNTLRQEGITKTKKK